MRIVHRPPRLATRTFGDLAAGQCFSLNGAPCIKLLDDEDGLQRYVAMGRCEIFEGDSEPFLGQVVLPVDAELIIYDGETVR